MIALLALLLLTSPAWGQVTVQNVTAQNVNIGISSATAAPDWSSYFQTVWRLDGNNSYPNDSTTTCGTNCGFEIENGDVVQDTSVFIEGTASQKFNPGDGGDSLECANNASNCQPIAQSTGSITWGGWMRANTNFSADHFNSQIGSNGFRSTRNTANTLQCQVCNGTSCFSAASAASSFPTGSWVHGGCQFDDAADFTQAYINGTASGSGTSSTTSRSASNEKSRSGAPGLWDGNIDESWIYQGVLSSAEICRICSCGVDGSACTCNGASWVSKGRNSSSCGSCDSGLSSINCDQASP